MMLFKFLLNLTVFARRYYET